MNSAELAQAMGVSEKDATAFVECLRVWVAKGYSVEQAIEKHMQQMRRMVNEAYEAISNPCKTEKAGDMKRAAADLLWETVH